MNYDVIIIGAGPGGIFAAYELMKKKPEVKMNMIDEQYFRFTVNYTFNEAWFMKFKVD